MLSVPVHLYFFLLNIAEDFALIGFKFGKNENVVYVGNCVYFRRIMILTGLFSKKYSVENNIIFVP